MYSTFGYNKVYCTFLLISMKANMLKNKINTHMDNSFLINSHHLEIEKEENYRFVTKVGNSSVASSIIDTKLGIGD